MSWNGFLDTLACSRVKMAIGIEFPAYDNPITQIIKPKCASRNVIT